MNPARGRRCRPVPILLLLLPGILPACRPAIADLPLSGGPPARAVLPADGEGELHVEYLGVGGWLIRFGNSAVLTAPLFSNPGRFEVALGDIASDTVLVDRFLPPVGDVGAILVGHGHYDHLLDVPYIARRAAPRARILGSRSTVNLLHGAPGLDPARLVDVEALAGDVYRPGAWIEVSGGDIRVMALRSAHAPHFMGVNFFSGDVESPLSTLPDRAADWLEGQTLAYLIDILGSEGEVLHRIHYQDAAASPPAGFPPHLPDRHPVDLLIVCVPGAEEVDGYPEAIVGHLEPRGVLLGHWEDFFRPRTESLRPSPGSDLPAFLRRLESALPDGGAWWVLDPGTVLRFGG